MDSLERRSKGKNACEYEEVRATCVIGSSDLSLARNINDVYSFRRVLVFSL